MEQPKPTAAPEAKLHFLDYWRIIRIRKTIIIIVFLLVVLTTVLMTIVMKPTYCGFARVKIAKDHHDIAGFEQQNPEGFDPYFIQTELLTIKSQKILDRVITNLNLNVEYGREFANQALRTSESRILLDHYLDISPARNANYLEIRYYSHDKEKAARIANEIANVYHDYRLEQLNSQTFSGIQVMKKDLEERQKKISDVKEEVDRLRTELGINEIDPASLNPTPTIEPETLRRLEAQRIELRELYAKEQAQLDDLKSMDREKLKNVIPTAASDYILNQLLLDLSQGENKLVTLKKDYGPENPEVQRTAALVDDLTKKVNDRIDGILVGLQSKVNADKAALDSLTTDVETARKTDQEKATKSRPYYDKKTELDQLQTLAKALNQRIAGAMLDLNLPSTTIAVVTDYADPTSMKAVRPNKPLNIALGVIVGLIVGVGLAFFIEYLDTSVKTIDDVERALQSPVLGVIPQNVGRLLDEGAESPHAEAYRVLRTNLLFARKDENLNSIAIVSAGAGEGKSTTIFNLATVFAQNGSRVVIVDSDLRRPSLHKLFKVANNIGLTNYLLKQNTLEEVIQTSQLPTLNFMASGKLPSSSLGILSSAQMKDLIKELKARYDYVFLDSPPIMGVSDASILASEVDMTLQVIQYRRYPQPMNIRAKQMIEKVGGNLMGIVLNNINMSQDESYYYYTGYYHEYYYHQDGDKDGQDGGNPAKAPKPA